jgi:Zn-dependent protease
LANILNNLNWNSLLDSLISLIAALACIIFHEVSHGYVAYRLGDKTAKDMGRLTINPFKHIDVFGLLSFVLFNFGWAKPVQIDPRNFKNPKRGMAISALAGPVSNFLMAIVFLFIYGLTVTVLSTGDIGPYVLALIARIVVFSVTLGVFNLIPMPPLDGSKILFAVASDELYYKLLRFERYGYIFLLLVILLNYQTNFLGTATEFVLNHLSFISQAAFNLVN